MLSTVRLNERFTVALTSDPAVMAEGRVREISPQADPMTRTHQVRIGLDNPRPALRLGATVTGRPAARADGLLAVPASALAPGAEAAVWVVDPQALTVGRRVIEVDSRDHATVLVKSGLKPGEIVVTAGAGTLAEGQTVRLPEGQS
jgi:RND family efflux transporter MFP subunit